MHAVVAEQMRIGLGAAEVIDRDRYQIVAPALDHGAQYEAPNASEPVDGDLHGHGCFPSVAFSSSAHPLADRGGDGLGRDTEVFVKIFIRRRGTEVGHADENPVIAEPALPA